MTSNVLSRVQRLSARAQALSGPHYLPVSLFTFGENWRAKAHNLDLLGVGATEKEALDELEKLIAQRELENLALARELGIAIDKSA
jgi:hypothetical protein